MIETQLTVDGKSTMHQGTSGITLTGTRTGDDMNTLIEYALFHPQKYGKWSAACSA